MKFKKANTTEADPKTKYPVIHVMPKQQEYLAKNQYGGTIRLGAWPCLLKDGSLLASLYKDHGMEKNSPWNLPRFKKLASSANGHVIYERHRHRYEFNNEFKQQFEKAGFVISGTSPDGKLVEAIELPTHRFFLGTQFHPEYISRPLTPHPVFVGFVNAVIQK